MLIIWKHRFYPEISTKEGLARPLEDCESSSYFVDTAEVMSGFRRRCCLRRCGSVACEEILAAHKGSCAARCWQGPETTEFRTAIFDDNDDAVRAALLSIIKLPAVAEGEPPLKKAKRSPEEYQFLDAVDMEESKVSTFCYYEKLLEAPVELPKSTEELRSFLSTRREKLPLENVQYSKIMHPDLVKRCTSAAEEPLKSFLYSAFWMMSDRLENEATSSSELYFLTGMFLKHLNEYAPADKQLRGLRCLSDSPNPETSETASEALLPLLRPNFQLFVENALMLRWENKIDVGDVSEAMEENLSKLKVWNPLYYSTLPYVIGGCCAGRQFRWLKLSPRGEGIVAEIISDVYDLGMPSNVAMFLHSIIRMHCLLQKLQGELGDHVPMKLYNILRCDGGGEVVFYPDFVHKIVRPPLEEKKLDMLQSLYTSIKGSRYLIQLKHCRALEGETQLQLEPVGYRYATPHVLKDLAAAVHDILHCLADSHKQGYTHRDLRWANCIKVNVQGEWKWVIIDLEAAGSDEEEWEGDGLSSWDERTSERKYTPRDRTCTNLESL